MTIKILAVPPFVHLAETRPEMQFKAIDARAVQANADYDRIHGPARVIAVPPERRTPGVPDYRGKARARRAKERAVDALIAGTEPEDESDER